MPPGLQRRASYGAASPLVGDRGARTRLDILNAALTTFSLRGFHNVSVEEISRRANVSRATVYQYFESKEQIFVELIEECGAALMTVTREFGPLGPTAEGFRTLRWWLEKWTLVYDRYAALFMQWEQVNSPAAPLRPLIDRYVTRYKQVVGAQLLTAGVEGIDDQHASLAIRSILLRVNFNRHSTERGGVSDESLLEAQAIVVQRALFPQTPESAFTAVGVRYGRPAKSPDPNERPFTRRPPMPPAPGGRHSPSAQRSAKTVRRLLDSAASVFSSVGFHGSTVEDIISSAGVARGTFYRYFDDKRAVLLALSQECLTLVQSLAQQLAELQPDDNFDRALKAVLTGLVETERTYVGVFKAWWQGDPDDPALAAANELASDSMLWGVERFLEVVDAPIQLDDGAAALVLRSLLEQLPHELMGAADDLPTAELVDVLASFIERGFMGAAVDRGTPSS